MITRKSITGRLKRLGMLLDHHFKIQGYKYESDSENSPYRISSKQFYNLLELQEVVDLKFRLDKMQKQTRKTNPLTTRTKLLKLNYIDVIMEDEQLKEAAVKILDKLIRRYENAQFQISIDIDEEEDFLDEYHR